MPDEGAVEGYSKHNAVSPPFSLAYTRTRCPLHSAAWPSRWLSLVTLLCSCLQFLKNGIPYMNEEQEKKIKHSILRGNWRVRR